MYFVWLWFKSQLYLLRFLLALLLWLLIESMLSSGIKIFVMKKEIYLIQFFLRIYHSHKGLGIFFNKTSVTFNNFWYLICTIVIVDTFPHTNTRLCWILKATTYVKHVPKYQRIRCHEYCYRCYYLWNTWLYISQDYMWFRINNNNYKKVTCMDWVGLVRKIIYLLIWNFLIFYFLYMFTKYGKECLKHTHELNR